VIFRSSRHFLGILFKSKGKRKTNLSAGPGFWPKASQPSWLAVCGACQAERSRGGDTSAQPTAGGGRHGAGSEGSPVAYAGKGGRREYEGSARDTRARRCVPRLTEAVGHRREGRVGDGWQRSDDGGKLTRASSDLVGW
jgi:hypothetical protein